MTNHINPLQVVLDRVCSADLVKGAFFFWDEVSDWPVGTLELLKVNGLLKPAQPMKTIVCDGCEENCDMPVAIYLAQESIPGRAFIQCDKRDDMGRVSVNLDRMKQWRCTIDAVCGFIASSLGLRRSDKKVAIANLWEIGVAKGAKRSQMLCLQASGSLELVAGGNKLPLIDVIEYRDGAYSLDDSLVMQLVDAKTTADKRYTPNNAKREVRKLDTQAMYEAWQKEYSDLRKTRPNMSEVWYSKQIAKMVIAKGRDADTIKKHMKS
ncbi:MAG: hypothetical protein Q8K83_04125 [Methylotenera sp.]|nr:hypothetical protein [Methylotenera sp.]